MSRTSSESGRRVDEGAGALVIVNRIGKALPDAVVHELLDDGIVGHLDYGTDASTNPEDVKKENKIGRGSLRRFNQFSRRGGYIVSHMLEGDRIILGRALGGCVRNEEIEGGKYDGKVLNCIQLDEYAEIEAGEFEAIDQLLASRTRSVFNPPDDDELAMDVIAAFGSLDRNGRLERSRR